MNEPTDKEKAQPAVPTKTKISEAIFGWGLRNDDGHNLSMDDTDEIAEYIVSRSPQPVVPEMVHILSILNGNIWHTEASENLKLAKDFELRLYADAALLSAAKGVEK
jgi:hypothetical protein